LREKTGKWAIVGMVLVASACANGGSESAHGASGKEKVQATNAKLEACGTAPLPDCPLQAWMKSMATPAITVGDLGKLERVFTRIAELAPAGYPDWPRIAKEGQRAAKEGSLEACRVACRDCHDTLRARYRAEDRARPIAK